MIEQEQAPRPARDSFARLKEKYNRASHAQDYQQRFTFGARKRSTNLLWRALRRTIGNTPKTILDVPTGTGRFAQPLAQMGHKVVGADYSSQMLHEAHVRHNGKGLAFLRCDVRKLPFADKSFDIVTCVRFFHLLQPAERIQVMRELRRVAREKIIVVYYPRHTIKQLTRWVRWKLGVISQPRTAYYPWKKIQEEIHAAGLQVVALRPVCRWFIDDWLIISSPKRSVGEL